MGVFGSVASIRNKGVGGRAFIPAGIELNRRFGCGKQAWNGHVMFYRRFKGRFPVETWGLSGADGGADGRRVWIGTRASEFTGPRGLETVVKRLESAVNRRYTYCSSILVSGRKDVDSAPADETQTIKIV